MILKKVKILCVLSLGVFFYSDSVESTCRCKKKLNDYCCESASNSKDACCHVDGFTKNPPIWNTTSSGESGNCNPECGENCRCEQGACDCPMSPDNGEERIYWMTDYNDDCPLASIVVTEDNCKNAATELGSEYKGSDRWVEAPAGCWQNGAKNWVFLNTITNPSLTRPNLGLRGICHDKGCSVKGARGNGRQRGTCAEDELCHNDGLCKWHHCTVSGSPGTGETRGSCPEGLLCQKDGTCLEPRLTKTENRYCRWEYDIYGSYDNLNAAISACKADTNCGYVYDEECDNKGMFELCKVNAETKQSMQGSCIYKQRD